MTCTQARSVHRDGRRTGGPGHLHSPPLAAVITGAARLMLAMLERCVGDLGGAWAFADTDSMAIVATPHGALVPCQGGAYRDQLGRDCVRALSYDDVEQIRNRFVAPNPYGPAIDGTILKRELDAFCYAIAAKRYALCRYDATGRPRLVPAVDRAVRGASGIVTIFPPLRSTSGYGARAQYRARRCRRQSLGNPQPVDRHREIRACSFGAPSPASRL